MGENNLPSVYVYDWMNECGLETEVLKGIATVKCLKAETIKGLPKEVETATGLFLWHLRHITAQDLEHMKHLKIISRVGMGFDNVDLKATGERGVIVTNVPDYGVEEVADSTICLLLNLLRKTHSLCNGAHAGHWPTEDAVGAERIRGKTLGIIGLGKIGKAVVERAKPFGLNIQFYDPYLEDGIDKSLGIGRVATLKELMESSNIISLHCYLDSRNYHMINKESLSWIKKGSYFINTARGALVDSAALLEVIKDGTLKAAAIDVIENEPYHAGPLLEHPNIMVTPHSAFYSDEGSHELRTKAALEIKRVLTGQDPRNCVNKLFLVKK